MPKITIKPYTISYHAKQKQIIEALGNGSTRLCLLAGRRFGKSFLAKSLIMLCLLGKSKRVAYVCPQYKYAKELYASVKQQLEELGLLKKGGSDWSLRSKTNSYFQVYSADNDKDPCRGDSWNLVIVDEAARVRNLNYVINQSILPTLAEKKGKLMVISTPQAINGDFFQLYSEWRKKMEDGDDTYFAVKGVSEENTYISKDEWINIRKSMSPEAQAVELDAIPSFESGRVFTTDTTNQLIEHLTNEEPIAYGLDLGIHVDYICLLAVNKANEIFQVHRFTVKDNKGEPNWVLAECKIKQLIGPYSYIPIFTDATGVGRSTCDHLKFDGLNIQEIIWTGKNKVELVGSLQRDLPKYRFYKPVADMLLTELGQYEYDISEQTGNISYSCKWPNHDDCVSALINLNWGLTTKALTPGIRKPTDIVSSRPGFKARHPFMLDRIRW